MGCLDPNPHVVGGGAERLRQGAVEVVVGVLEKEAQALIRPWQKFITEGAAYLSLKLALSLDGRIASRTGASKWITCQESRTRVQTLRAAHDAVMVGINTVLADDPRLTVRDVPGRSPIRIVVDSNLRITTGCQVVATAREVPTCVVTTVDASRAVAEALEQSGVTVIRVPATAEGRCDMRLALRELAAREVVSVLCEGGAELSGSLLVTGLPDELHAFIAPILLGPRGRPGAVDWAGPENPGDAPRIEAPRWELCGNDAYVSGVLVYPKRSGPRTVAG
jgi:diaminohydroxyphosphoribosylaminopyrimidine deaminase/5-amino-6-(5-phosphoribosylamino)uracil reductase